MRGCPASAAGSDDAPGSVSPRASAMRHHGGRSAHGHARAERTRDAVLDIGPVRLGDRAGALLVPVLPSVRAGAQRLPAPVAAQHRARRGDRSPAAPWRLRPMINPGVVLSQPPRQYRAVDGMRAQQFLGLHRQEVAVEHGRWLDERFGQRDRRQLQRKAARLQHAALHVFGARAQVRVAGVDVAPRVDDADHGLAAPILGIVADLAQSRAMPERAQVLGPEPAMAAQVFRRSFAKSCAQVLARSTAATTNAGRATPCPIYCVKTTVPPSAPRR